MSVRPREASGTLLRSAGAMGLATLCSRVLGLVREQVLAVLFGAGDLTDAFQVAFRIPNLLRNLFAEGALSASLVPVFTGVRELEGERRAWRVAGLVFLALALGVGGLSVAGMIFAAPLVELYASAFHATPGKFELTVELTRALFPFFPVVALSAAFMGVLNACGWFFLPAFSAALFNVVSVTAGVPLALLFFRVERSGGGELPPILGIAIGIVAGAAAQALFQYPALRRAGFRWQSRLPTEPSALRDPALGRMLRLMLPGTLGLAATQLTVFVTTVLATREGPGAVSCLHYAFRLLQFPIGLFGVSLATAALPRLSRDWVRRDLPEVETILMSAMRHTLAANVPAAAGLIALGVPIIALLFQYGRFAPEDAHRTGCALALYALGLPAYALVKVLVPACYAVGNTRIAVISSVVTVGVTTLLSLLLAAPLGIYGLALATSVGAYLNAGTLLFSLRTLLREAGGRLDLPSLGAVFLRQTLLAAAMGAIAWATYRGLDLALPELPISTRFGAALVLPNRVFKVGAAITIAIAAILVISRRLAIRDTTEVFDLFTEKLKKKLSAAQK